MIKQKLASVKCTCGELIKQYDYESLVKEEKFKARIKGENVSSDEIKRRVMDIMNVRRRCCRTTYLNPAIISVSEPDFDLIFGKRSIEEVRLGLEMSTAARKIEKEEKKIIQQKLWEREEALKRQIEEIKRRGEEVKVRYRFLTLELESINSQVHELLGTSKLEREIREIEGSIAVLTRRSLTTGEREYKKERKKIKSLIKQLDEESVERRKELVAQIAVLSQNPRRNASSIKKLKTELESLPKALVTFETVSSRISKIRNTLAILGEPKTEEAKKQVEEYEAQIVKMESIDKKRRARLQDARDKLKDYETFETLHQNTLNKLRDNLEEKKQELEIYKMSESYQDALKKNQDKIKKLREETEFIRSLPEYEWGEKNKEIQKRIEELKAKEFRELESRKVKKHSLYDVESIEETIGLLKKERTKTPFSEDIKKLEEENSPLSKEDKETVKELEEKIEEIRKKSRDLLFQKHQEVIGVAKSIRSTGPASKVFRSGASNVKRTLNRTTDLACEPVPFEHPQIDLLRKRVEENLTERQRESIADGTTTKEEMIESILKSLSTSEIRQTMQYGRPLKTGEYPPPREMRLEERNKFHIGEGKFVEVIEVRQWIAK
jgi:DNA-directed RNA polymerase subunit N (RpoN/RPB10)